MRSPLNGRTLLLGVTGSIAAFKAAALASRLAQEGARVITLLTPSATRFITPLTFRSLTGQPAYTQEDLWGSQGHILHIGLAQQADAMLIVPCTAETLAQLAQGHGNTLVSLAALALNPAQKPLLVAPAMDGAMYHHPAVQQHLETLRRWGVHILGPVEGRLASGLVAQGRMMEPEDILAYVRDLFARRGPLAGYHVLVTAGPTREPLDPVRVFTNRSSGRQGFALARTARLLGAQVTLITGPSALPTPYGVQRVDVETAHQMLDALMAHLPQTDILFKSAAVADYRPQQVHTQKVRKGQPTWTLTLEANPDLLLHVRQYRQQHGRPRWVVGFAAESHLDEDRALEKLRAKDLDLLLLNDISRRDAGFAAETNTGIIFDRDGHRQAFPVMPKDRVAALLLAWVLYFLQERRWFLGLGPREWFHVQQTGHLWTPSMALEGRLELCRWDQRDRWLERHGLADAASRVHWLALHGPAWRGKWSWEWRDDDWWPVVQVDRPLPLDAFQVMDASGRPLSLAEPPS